MRVTGGDLAGRRLRVPRGAHVRPSADRLRESLFGRLGALDGSEVLDLYAGSGALGIEALSRGAQNAVFVDRASACLTAIRRNLEQLGLSPRARVQRGDAVTAIARLGARGQRFDLVLADPPYASGEAPRLLDAVVAAGLLAPGGMLVLETSRRHAPGPRPGLRIEDARRYGDTLVVRYVEGRADPVGAESGSRSGAAPHAPRGEAQGEGEGEGEGEA